MRKLTEYRAVIADLDGTLYFKNPVRIAMLKEMALHCWRIGDFWIVYKYRKLYEQGYGEAERMARLPESAPRTIQEWMIDRPLPYVAKYRDDFLIMLLKQAMNAGVTVIVYSDYPVKEKLTAIDFTPDQAYSADDLGCMKPNAAGLARILKDQGIAPEECLIIGDRVEKDGMLAFNMGADHLILPLSQKARVETYTHLAIR